MTDVDTVFYYAVENKEIDGEIWRGCCPSLLSSGPLNWVDGWWEQWPSEWVKKSDDTGLYGRLVHPNLFSILCLKYEVY